VQPAEQEPTKLTPAGSLLGSGAVYALASVAPVLATLLVTPLVTRLLGASEYGFAGISITLYQVGSVLLALGLPFAITRHAIMARSALRGAVALVLIGAATALALASLLFALLPQWGAAMLGTEHVSILVWPLISSVGLALVTLSQSFLRAVNRVYAFVALSCISAILGPVLGLTCITVLGPTAGNFLAGLATGHTIAGLVGIVITVAHARPSFSRLEALQSFVIGLPTLPHSLATSFLVSALVVLSSHIYGVEDAGRLQLALLLGTAPMVILAAFNNSWAPMVYRASDATRPAVLERSFRAIAALVFVLVAGFCVLARLVVGFIVGPDLFNDELLRTALLVTSATPFMALYLANIHMVFLRGVTWPLAIATPLSLGLSLVFAVVCSTSFVEERLPVFALAVAAFHLAQWASSSILVRFTGYAGARIAPALPVLLGAFVTSVIVALLLPPEWVLAPAIVAAVAVVLYFNRRVLRIRVAS
jgi:O-antigen/teichoic acid export membrane protein